MEALCVGEKERVDISTVRRKYAEEVRVRDVKKCNIMFYLI